MESNTYFPWLYDGYLHLSRLIIDSPNVNVPIPMVSHVLKRLMYPCYENVILRGFFEKNWWLSHHFSPAMFPQDPTNNHLFRSHETHV